MDHGKIILEKRDSPEPLFRERTEDQLRRWGLGAAYALRPKRTRVLPRLAAMTATYLLNAKEQQRLPDPPLYHGERGLVGISDDLSVPHLLAAYRAGYFPFCHIGPMNGGARKSVPCSFQRIPT